MSRVPHLMQWLNMSLGVDAIIHVASPLAHTAAPEVILDVRNRPNLIFCQLVDQVLFLGGRLLGPRAYSTLLLLSAYQATRRHGERCLARLHQLIYWTDINPHRKV
jgi:hypothetical protein